jgi:hypothetical protein
MLKRSPQRTLKTYPPIVSIGIVISPPVGQLSLSTGNPGSPHNGYKVLNRDENEAELSKARVDKYRARQVDIMKDGEKKPHPRACCNVVYDEDILNMLVGMGQILDAETEDSKEVGKAISEMLAEAAQDWKTKH